MSITLHLITHLSIKHGEQARNLTTLSETVQGARGLSEAHTGQTIGARVARTHYVEHLNIAEARLTRRSTQIVVSDIYPCCRSLIGSRYYETHFGEYTYLSNWCKTVM